MCSSDLPLGCPWAGSASFHIGEDEEDLTPLILEFYGTHGHIETTFSLESVKVIACPLEQCWCGNLRRLWEVGRGWGVSSRGLCQELVLQGLQLGRECLDLFLEQHGVVLRA